ncbi:HAD hydrolase-like protein [Actinomycetospora termitidis]|uniref:HAD hydrolase-like protein n=1 Tax=Actinomycetospora termitidis TaxID=3053470 RepID=A0ABT7M703_9PSEU|nr:HAD hydrolase-like protein [Actinomycetospora sp. Odt1-22]MDL5156450.1 HAD hydrolase-like protein [Actinomycetospora sp. Odt1-22]
MTAKPSAPPSLRSPLVCFDLDGTLVDSGPGIRASVRHSAATVGIDEPDAEQLRALIGPPFPRAFRDVLGVDAPTADAMMAAYRAYYGGGAMFDVEVYPGVPDLLAELVARGDTLAITTSKPREYADEIVAHLGLDKYVAAGVFGAGDDVEGKAAVVGLALARHDGPVVGLVGDRSHDVEGARAHGLPCVGVDWGFGGRAELIAAGAAAVVDTPAEVPAALDGLR